MVVLTPSSRLLRAAKRLSVLMGEIMPRRTEAGHDHGSPTSFWSRERQAAEISATVNETDVDCGGRRC